MYAISSGVSGGVEGACRGRCNIVETIAAMLVVDRLADVLRTVILT